MNFKGKWVWTQIQFQFLKWWKLNFSRRNEDILQIPLQPLYNNLDTYTYEIFEKDPVKYIFYQHAIEQALRDKIPDDEIETKTVFYLLSFCRSSCFTTDLKELKKAKYLFIKFQAIIMVVGAGRGPLVRSTINASKNTKRKIHIFVIEKNPNAIVTLQALREELWSEESEFSTFLTHQQAFF